MRVRPCAPGDEGPLAALVQALNRDQGDTDQHFGPDAVARDVLGPEPRIGVLVAEDDDATLAGYAAFHVAYESPWALRGLYLCDLYVRPQTRRRGIGRALVAALAATARHRGNGYLWWMSKPGNAAGHAFYKALGATFEPVVAHALVFGQFDALAREGARVVDSPPDAATGPTCSPTRS